MKKINFSWKIWAKKVLKVFLVGGVLSLISFVEAIPISPESAFYMTIALTLLQAIENYIKHS